eukprot:m.30501 g.30501  ORF g.30501 m.30501 type:complete len:701 (+) comp31349_c0_seq2:60-2162(+)
MAEQDLATVETPLLANIRDQGRVDDAKAFSRRYPAGISRGDYVRRQRYAGMRSRFKKDKTTDRLDSNSSDLSLVSAAEFDIYSAILQQQEMADNIKAQPWPMADKLRYYNELMGSIKEKQACLATIKNFNFRGLQAVEGVAQKVSALSRSWKLWESPIQLVEGYFGTGVGSYFVFLRRLFALNLLLALLLLIPFVIVPQIISGKGTSVDSNIIDSLANSFLFYGYYYDGQISPGYSMSVAFLVINGVVFICSFIYILRRMWIDYRSSKLSGLHNDFPFCWRVFLGWDYSINKQKGADFKHAAITTQLQEEVQEFNIQNRRRLRHYGQTLCLRLIANAIVLSLLGGSAYLVYYFVHRSEDRRTFSTNWFLALVEKFELSLVLLALRIVVIPIFEKVVVIERWHPRTAFKWTLVRTTAFYAANVVALLLSLLGEPTNPNCTNSTNTTATPLPTEEPNSLAYICCWETYVGVEIVKVVMIDFGGEILSVLLADLLRALFVRYICGKKLIGFHEFSITSNILGLIYGQSLIWLGTLFCPVLPALQVIKLFFVFYMRRIAVVYTNVPPKRIYRASRSGNFVQVLLLLVLFACILPFGYVIAALKPSTVCGPFRTEAYIYQVIAEELPSWTNDVLRVVGSPAFTVPVIVFLLLIIFYYSLVSRSYHDVIKDLRTQLHFERHEGSRQVFNIANQRQDIKQSTEETMA